MKRLVIKTIFDTCYIGENRINMRFSFVEGVSECVASCPDEKIYIEYDENIVSQQELIDIVKDMEFPVNGIESD